MGTLSWLNWVPGEKPLGARNRTNNKLNPHRTPSLGIEPGPHWWEASALTTAPSLLSPPPPPPCMLQFKLVVWFKGFQTTVDFYLLLFQGMLHVTMNLRQRELKIKVVWKSSIWTTSSYQYFQNLGSGDGPHMRPLASRKCGPGSNSRVDAMSSFLVLNPASKDFLHCLQFFPLLKTPNFELPFQSRISCRHQFFPKGWILKDLIRWNCHSICTCIFLLWV